MRHFIKITEKDETSRYLVRLLRSLSKENQNIDFLTEDKLEDIIDLRLAKKARKDAKKAVPFAAFMEQEKKRRNF